MLYFFAWLKSKFPKLTLIDDWQKAYKLYSVWFFIILGSLPQIWDTAVSSGLLDTPLIPPAFKALVGTISAIALVARLVKQQAAVLEAEVKAKLAADESPKP